MSRYFDIRNTVLIVVGYGILPEEEDRPLAYDLKRLIMNRTRGQEGRSAVVLTDIWALNQEMAEFFPIISVGGPSVNAYTAQTYEELPVVFARDQQLFIQMDQESGKRAAVWGMNESGTREAVEIFARDGFLDQFLDLVWGRTRE